MKPVGNFLSRFQKLTPPDGAIRKAVADAITDITRVPLSQKNVSIKNGIAFISASSIAKNAIRMRRIEILSQVSRVLPRNATLHDIR